MSALPVVNAAQGESKDSLKLNILFFSFFFSSTTPGIQVEFDLSRPVGQRVVTLALLCTTCRVPKYEPLELGKVYKLALTSYMVGGGDGFTMIELEKLKHDTGE